MALSAAALDQYLRFPTDPFSPPLHLPLPPPQLFDHIFSVGHRYDRRILLGCVSLPITAIPGTDPIFIWLPLR